MGYKITSKSLLCMLILMTLLIAVNEIAEQIILFLYHTTTITSINITANRAKPTTINKFFPQYKNQDSQLRLYLEDLQKLMVTTSVNDSQTNGCQWPQLQPNADIMKGYFKKLPPLQCNGTANIFYLSVGKVHLNHTAYHRNNQQFDRCVYSPIIRSYDATFIYGDEQVVHKYPWTPEELDADFTHVCCYIGEEPPNNSSKSLVNRHDETMHTMYSDPYEQTDATLTGKLVFEQFLVKTTPILSDETKTNESLNTNNHLNILIYSIDSMSHLAYQRFLPRTYSYLKNKMNAIIFNGYNVVGDATVANIVPMLTGRRVEALPDVRSSELTSEYVDVYPLIWKDFKKKGYLTLYAEDEPTLATFNLQLNGFLEQPTDHYMRPFWQAIWASHLNTVSQRFCEGPIPKHQYTLDYVLDYFRTYRAVPKFAFAFHGELTHAHNNPAQHLDTDLLQFIHTLHKERHLDNTVLMVISDHGARFSKFRKTFQGKLEERLPMLAVVLPQWFRDKYKSLTANVKLNSNRLITSYDIYHTLLDFVHNNSFTQKENKNNNLHNLHHNISYGSSLLQRIPRERGCEDAGVESHWCTCLSWFHLPEQHPLAARASLLIVTYINNITSYHYPRLCRILSVRQVSNASVVMPPVQMLKYRWSSDDNHRVAGFFDSIHTETVDVQVNLITAPNNASYEGTVRLWLNGTRHEIVGTGISRLNKYGNQARCVMKKPVDVRKYCHCVH